MALATFERVKPLLFAHEGGYVDHPNDPGGATNWGITIGTLAAWRGGKVTKADVKAMSRDEAAAIYKTQYWDTVKGDALPSGVDYCVYDYSVNSGPARAAKELQRVVGAGVDGVVGAETLRRVQDCGKSSSQIIDEICNRRLAFMKRLKHWSTFGRGWSRRVADVRLKAKSFAADAPITDMPVSDVPTPKARPEDKGVTDSLKKPETWLPYIGGGGGILSMFTEPGPLQWALAFGVVVAIGLGSYYIIKRIQRDDD
jgi:lysozyme family protein